MLAVPALVAIALLALLRTMCRRKTLSSSKGRIQADANPDFMLAMVRELSYAVYQLTDYKYVVFKISPGWHCAFSYQLSKPFFCC